MRGENILVTGGSGFVGRSLVRSLLDAGAHVTVADTRPHPDDRVESVTGDLRDPDVRDAAVRAGMSGIFHLAARTSVLESVSDPAGVYDTNVAVTAGLLELARQREVRRFVMASTNAVVGDIGVRAITEDVPLRPLTPYGATKAACEMLLAGYAGSYSLLTSAVRLTNVYGPGMELKDSFVPRLMRAARDGSGVRIYGDGKQVRDLVHVHDAVRGFLLAWNTGLVGSVIIGSGRSVSVLDLVEAARAVTGVEIEATHVPAKPGEMPAVVVDITKASDLGYHPRVDLAAGLATVWEEFRRSDTADSAADDQRGSSAAGTTSGA